MQILVYQEPQLPPFWKWEDTQPKVESYKALHSFAAQFSVHKPGQRKNFGVEGMIFRGRGTKLTSIPLDCFQRPPFLLQNDPYSIIHWGILGHKNGDCKKMLKRQGEKTGVWLASATAFYLPLISPLKFSIESFLAWPQHAPPPSNLWHSLLPTLFHQPFLYGSKKKTHYFVLRLLSYKQLPRELISVNLLLNNCIC